MSDEGFAGQIAETLKWEGGYSLDQDDPGGETNFGISKRSYPDLEISTLTKADAIAIYRRDYWKKPGLDQLPPLVGAKVFDLGVNMGPRTAIKLLQRAVNRLQPLDLINEDGVLGPATLGAVAALDPLDLVNNIRTQAATRYHHIADAHPNMRKFLGGWLRRASA